MHDVLIQEFSKSKALKEKADQIDLGAYRKDNTPKSAAPKTPEVKEVPKEEVPAEPKTETPKVEVKPVLIDTIKAPEGRSIW